MLDFWKFYLGLSSRSDHFDDYWERFPTGHLFQFKRETLFLLRENVSNRDPIGLANTLAVICRDGADSDYTEILLNLLDETWHISEEDIVEVLELIKDPKSIEKLYEVAVNIPDYDEMRALAKKCMWALSAINTPEAIHKLKLLQNSVDPIIKENASFQLEHLTHAS